MIITGRPQKSMPIVFQVAAIAGAAEKSTIGHPLHNYIYRKTHSKIK